MRVALLVVAALVLCAAAAQKRRVSLDHVTAENYQITSLPVYGQFLSKNYAGYMPLAAVNASGEQQMFFWFIESENNPATDPVLLWLTGGPGCSGLLANLEENGPYTVRHGEQFYLNDFRWTTNASVLYIESPPGVGYSPNTGQQWTDMMTAEANYELLVNFFASPLGQPFSKQPFFITGESYAGHYGIQVAEKIFDGPDAALRARVRAVMLGNPCTGSIGCGNPDPTLDVFLQYNGFRPLNASVPTAKSDLIDPYDLLAPVCTSDQLLKRTSRWTEEGREHPVIAAYARRRAALGDAPVPYGPCADDFVTAWLNRADVKAALHAWANITWQECSTTLNYAFNGSSVVGVYKKLFAGTNWNFTIYSGTSDSVVNFVQSQTIVAEQMGRPFVRKEFVPWNYPDVYNATGLQLGGFYLHYDRMCWAGVRDSGHMVPQFNPPAAKGLLNSILAIGRPGLH